MGSFSEDSSEKNKLIIGIWAGVYLTTPCLLPPALNACYAGYTCICQPTYMSYIWKLFHNTYSAKSHINADKTILHDRGRYFKRMVKGIKDPAAKGG